MQASADIAKQLQDYDSTRKNSVDVLNEAMGKFGVPEIRSRVSGLRTTLSNTENALNAVDPSVTGRTQGSLVTEAQRQRQVSNERAPITEQYGQQSRALGNESANLSDQLGAAQLLASQTVSDYDRGRSALSDRYGLALGAENEVRRRQEADRAFNLQQSEANRAAASSGGYNLLPPPPPSAGDAPTVQDQAYTSVQRFLQGNDAQIRSDYAATLKSAQKGNALDKLKVQLYQQQRPDLFSGPQVTVSKAPSGGAVKVVSAPKGNVTVGKAQSGSVKVVR
ncbi:MAG: hypothetical protein ABIR46_03135 [Candidatus Saccharimonadales bacterium]